MRLASNADFFYQGASSLASKPLKSSSALALIDLVFLSLLGALHELLPRIGVIGSNSHSSLVTTIMARERVERLVSSSR
jgi:hypothetical protein